MCYFVKALFYLHYNAECFWVNHLLDCQDVSCAHLCSHQPADSQLLWVVVVLNKDFPLTVILFLVEFLPIETGNISPIFVLTTVQFPKRFVLLSCTAAQIWNKCMRFSWFFLFCILILTVTLYQSDPSEAFESKMSVKSCWTLFRVNQRSFHLLLQGNNATNGHCESF